MSPDTPIATPATKAGQTVRVNSATLIMGVTGSGKSSLLYTLALWVWEKFGLVTVLNTTDGGGFPTKIQALIQAGIVWPIRLRTRDNAQSDLSFETCLRAAQGWLPVKFDPKTGQVEPGCKMVPPVTEQHAMYCPNGHRLKTVAFKALLTPVMCATCKTHTTTSNMRVVTGMHRTTGFDKIGAVMFDGLSSMLTWMEQDLGQRAGRMEIKGEESALGGKVTSGDLKLGGTTRSHVGFVQSRAHELVLNSLSIPYLVVPPVWTALTLETTDEGGLSIRGPKLSGRAKTDEGPSWFGNCLETSVVKDDKDQRIFRLYLSEFTDEAGVRHLVKHRGAPGTMPPYLEDPPLKGDATDANTAFQNFNLGVFFDLLDASQQQTLTEVTEKYPNAPGLPSGLIEVGDPVTAAGIPPAVVAPGGQPGAPPPAQPMATGVAGRVTAPAPGPGGGTSTVGPGGSVAGPTPPTQPAKPAPAGAPRAPVGKPKAKPAAHPATAQPGLASVRQALAAAAAQPEAPPAAGEAQVLTAADMAGVDLTPVEPAPEPTPPAPASTPAPAAVTAPPAAVAAPPAQAAPPVQPSAPPSTPPNPTMRSWAPPAAPRPPAAPPRVAPPKR